ncbi:MAG: ATP-binding protein [Spirulina sp. SIO3F2]|nr:ATP-binding protein [Spirulina sp. SIO3F2]
MSQLYGEFIEKFPPENDSLEITFTPSSRPIKQRWRNNRLSAYFVADYFITFLPFEEEIPGQEKRIRDSKGAVSYVANELLENAMKFNNNEFNQKIKFGIQFLDKPAVTAAIYTTNTVDPKIVGSFKAYVQHLLDSDPSELYLQQVEKSLTDPGEGSSGLGLITMLNDYSAKLGWKFDHPIAQSDIITVTTMAQIAV